MKRLLLTLTIFVLGLTSHAQLTCDTATPITANGTFTAPAITGTYLANCFTNTTTSAGGPLQAVWFKYTATANGSVVISSNLPTNVAPKSVDTKLAITTGTCGALVCTTSNDDINPAATGGNYLSSVSFAVTTGTTYYIAWDNSWNAATFDFTLTYSAVAICNPVITTRLATAVTANSATLNWLPAVGNPAAYEIEYGVTGFTQGTGTIVPSTTVSATLCTADLFGLNENAIYDFYVRSNCGAGNFSPWTTVRGFALLQLVPYVSNFDTGASRASWSVSGTAGAVNFNNLPGNAQSGTIYSFFNSSTTAVSNNRLFTPQIELTQGQSVIVSFWSKNSTSANRSFRVTAGIATTAAGQSNIIWTNTALNNTAYAETVTLPFVAPADGNYYFAFHDVTPIATGAISTLFLDTISILSAPLANDSFSSNTFSISPNPANDFVTVSSKNAAISNIEMTDINGRIVKAIKVGNVNETELNISDLSSGVYMLKIASENGVSTKKIIKN